MCKFKSSANVYLLSITLVLFELLTVSCEIFSALNLYGSGSGETNFAYNSEDRESQVALALSKLKQSPKYVDDWPKPVQLGQVSAVTVDKRGRVLIFQRASNTWDAGSFDFMNRYRGADRPPIPVPTVITFNEDGDIVEAWGQNKFYMPHGLFVDHEDNVWVTDVALHQVFKFTSHDKSQPSLTLGDRLVPGNDDNHFCKPSAVAVMSTGDFFVSDGYCNARIIKYDAKGNIILQWGRQTPPHLVGAPPPYAFLVPHALALAEDKGAVCVADREHGRAQCFHAANGTYLHHYASWLIDQRLFSIAYTPRDGGLLYVVNGPSLSNVAVKGYVIEFDSGKIVQVFDTPSGFRNPHDVAISPDGSQVYVVELDPHSVHKFTEDIVKEPAANRSIATKPPFTIEGARLSVEGDAAVTGWWGVAGGVAVGVTGAVLCVAAAACALLRARTRGWAKVRERRRRWEARGEFKLSRLLEPRGFTRVNTEESDEEPTPRTTMLPPNPQSTHA